MQYIELKEQLKNFKIFNLNDVGHRVSNIRPNSCTFFGNEKIFSARLTY